jgi:hypothetical protein
MIGLLMMLAVGDPIELRDVYGIGNDTCQSAFTPQRKAEREIWIMGYLSGLNSAGAHNVPVSQRAADMIDLVRIECAKHPKDTLGFAASVAHSHQANRF